MRVWDVGIVGGGPGGLMTAWTLQKLADRPVRVTLYEASGRLGGKILTPTFASAPVSYEAGAAEFYDYSWFDDDPLKQLIADLGLPIGPMAGSAVIMDNRVLSNLDDIRTSLGPKAYEALCAFDREARDRMTPMAFCDSDYPEGSGLPAVEERFDALLATVTDAEARRYIERLIHSDLATEPGMTSPAYGLQNYLMNDPAYMGLYSIEGGNERLSQALAARIDADILLEHPVKRVSRTDGGRLRIEAVHGGEPHVADYDYVVVALPHNQVKSVSFGGAALADAVDRHHAYYHHPAHYLRMTLLFDAPFWQELLTDSFWMLDHFGGCCLYDESSREPGGTHGVLGWLLGGDAALEMSALADDALIEAALDSLPDFLPDARAHFMEGRVHRWIAAVNAMPGGVAALSQDERHRPDPAGHPNLFMVGDYLFDTTLNGVLDSATYAAAWLAAEMTDYNEEAG